MSTHAKYIYMIVCMSVHLKITYLRQIRDGLQMGKIFLLGVKRELVPRTTTITISSSIQCSPTRTKLTTPPPGIIDLFLVFRGQEGGAAPEGEGGGDGGPAAAPGKRAAEAGGGHI